jgi:hypothetical protein
MLSNQDTSPTPDSKGESLVTMEGPGPLAPIGAPRVLDWSRPVRTVLGHTLVHIYAIDHNLAQPVVGRPLNDNAVLTWHLDGLFYSDRHGTSGLDLENVPETEKGA